MNLSPFHLNNEDALQALMIRCLVHGGYDKRICGGTDGITTASWIAHADDERASGFRCIIRSLSVYVHRLSVK